MHPPITRSQSVKMAAANIAPPLKPARVPPSKKSNRKTSAGDEVPVAKSTCAADPFFPKKKKFEKSGEWPGTVTSPLITRTCPSKH